MTNDANDMDLQKRVEALTGFKAFFSNNDPDLEKDFEKLYAFFKKDNENKTLPERVESLERNYFKLLYMHNVLENRYANFKKNIRKELSEGLKKCSDKPKSSMCQMNIGSFDGYY